MDFVEEEPIVEDCFFTISGVDDDCVPALNSSLGGFGMSLSSWED